MRDMPGSRSSPISRISMSLRSVHLFAQFLDRCNKKSRVELLTETWQQSQVFTPLESPVCRLSSYFTQTELSRALPNDLFVQLINCMPYLNLICK